LRSTPSMPRPAPKSRRSLKAKLISSYVAISLVITLMSLAGGRLIEWDVGRQRGAFSELLQKSAELLSLAGSISEEGFSYIVSGDESEAEKTLAKLKEFHSRAFEARGSLSPDDPKAAALDVVQANADHLRDAAVEMFGEFRVKRSISREIYEHYDDAVDQLSDQIKVLHAVVAEELVTRERRAQRMADWLTLAAGIATVLAGLGMGRAFGLRITRPIVALRDAAIAFGAGRRDAPVPVTSDDEVGELTLALNGMMTERERQELELRQAHKMDAIGRLAGGIAHDFNNMLSIILGYTTFLLDGLSETSPLYEPLSEMKIAGERSADLTRQLLAFGRQDEILMGRVDLSGSVEATANMVKRILPKNTAVTVESDPMARDVVAAPGHIEQVVMNLVINARDAMPKGGTIAIASTFVQIDEVDQDSSDHLPIGAYMRLSVSDSGTGMDRHTLERIFEPFFTTKEQGKGTGLGLSSVFGVVQQCKGQIFVESALGRGTTFRVFFPALPNDPSSLEPAATEGRSRFNPAPGAALGALTS
jgi:signal transduction histidine kinase